MHWLSLELRLGLSLGLSLEVMQSYQVAIIFKHFMVFRNICIHSFISPYYPREARSRISLGLFNSSVGHLGLRLTLKFRHNLIFVIVVEIVGLTSGFDLEIP